MGKTSGAVRELLVRAVAAGSVPGAVAAWSASGGPPSAVAVGHGVVGGRSRPLAVDDWFDLASLTKPLATTTLCLLAVREGRLGLSTRVGEVLPEASPLPVGAIPLVQLLNHTSGLPAWRPIYAEAAGDPTRAHDALLRLPLQHRPGERVEYSCLGFLLLGWMLEQVLQAPLDRCLETRVLGRLGLSGHIGFRPDPGMRPIVAGAGRATVEEGLLRQAGLDPGLVPPTAEGMPDDGNARFLGGAAGNAGLFGTASGVLGLAEQYLGPRSRLLDRSQIRLATGSRTYGLEQSRGLGWQLARTIGCSAGSALAPDAFGHTGYTGTSVWVDPTRDVVLVLLAHRHHPAHRGIDLHPLRRRFHSLVVYSRP